VASYAVAGLGPLVMLAWRGLPGFMPGYAMYSLNSVGWPSLAALLSGARASPRVMVLALSTSVRAGAALGGAVVYRVAGLPQRGSGQRR